MSQSSEVNVNIQFFPLPELSNVFCFSTAGYKSNVNMSFGMIKLVALDIDGTITEEDQTINSETVLALRKLKERESPPVISLVSGNALPVMVGIRNTTGIGDILFAENGGIMMSYLENPVNNIKCIERNNLLTLNRGEIVKRANILKFFHRDLPEIELERIKKHFDIQEFFTNKWRETSLSIQVKRDDVNNIISGAVNAEVQDSGYAVHIMNPGQNKGFALREIMKYLSLEREEVLACGDGGNDIDMFREAGASGVPENASTHARENATYASKHSYGKGLIDILNHFDLV